MKIIIIGGVAAGMSAAKVSRLNKDAELVIYEKTEIVSWGACGLPYYVGNFYEDPNNMIARPVHKFLEAGMNIKIKHEVINVNPEKKEITVKNLENGEIFKDSYDKLMIATGAAAIMPPIKNISAKGVYTLKDYTDGIILKKEMMKEENQEIIIIGAGYIGIEVVEAAKHLGKRNIRLIQLGERVLMESFDKEITDIMEEEIRKHDGINLHLNETVLEILEENGKIKGVKTNKGEYSADLAGVKTSFKGTLGSAAVKVMDLEAGRTGITEAEAVKKGINCKTVFVTNMSGHSVDLTLIVMSIIVVSIGSLGIAGIPGTATMAASVGLSGTGLFPLVNPILAIDPIIDMPRTMLNVIGSVTNAIMVDKSLGQINLSVYNDPEAGNETAANGEFE